MWLNHLKVTIAFALATVAIICLIPVSILTGNYDKVSLNDTIDLYKEIADDIYSK